MLRRTTLVLGFALSLLATACGGSGGGGSNGDPDAAGSGGPDADPNAPDADPTRPDADPNAPDAAPCTPGTTQCSNCLDDDSDGTIDGADAECAGSLDNDEGTFATGIMGDNRDPYAQDCFFDGNSGAGQDCAWHTCCLFPDGACPPHIANHGNGFDRARDCGDQSGACLGGACAELAPPGCDCFGCCTVCKDTTCKDVLINPILYPSGTTCDYENLNNCYECIKNTQCGADECNDNPDDCVLCPGQDEADLPSTCSGAHVCPGDLVECDTNDQCGDGYYCSSGCCILSID